MMGARINLVLFSPSDIFMDIGGVVSCHLFPRALADDDTFRFLFPLGFTFPKR